MKLFKTLALVSGIASTAGVQAASLGEMNVIVDWSSLSITGASMVPSSIFDPVLGQNMSSDAEGMVGGESGLLDEDNALNGASATASYSDASLDLTAGYNATSDQGYGNVMVNNTGSGVQSGYALSWGGFIYEATSTGTATVSVSYSLSGSVETDSLFDYANAGYEVLMDATDADLWVSAYNSEFASNGGDSEAAEDVADLAAVLDFYIFNDWTLLECFGDIPCIDSTTPGMGGSMSVTFDVVSGTRYSFGGEGVAGVYTDVSAVPVPAAVWLFGSGLLGLVGVARRNKA